MREAFDRHARLADVCEAPESHAVGPVCPPDQEGTVSIEQAEGLDPLAAASPRALREVAELDDTAGGDGLAESSQQVAVEPRPGTRTHGEPLGLRERFHVGLDPHQRVRVQGGPKPGVQLT